MLKYILILTRSEYAISFNEFVNVKQKLQYQIEFAFVDEERFSTFDLFSAFVRKKNPDADPEKAFFLLIGGSELYYGINASFGDFQYAHCSDSTIEMKLYCTVGRIPGTNAIEIENVCNNILRYGNINRKLKFLPICGTNEHVVWWEANYSTEKTPFDATFPNLVKKDFLTKLRPNELILYMGHGETTYLQVCSRFRVNGKEINSLHPDKQFHILAWACYTCRTDDCIGIKCLSGGSAVTFWGARDVTKRASNLKMIDFFMKEWLNMRTNKTMGEIFYSIMSNVHKTGDLNLLGNAMKYTFLGDPTILVTV